MIKQHIRQNTCDRHRQKTRQHQRGKQCVCDHAYEQITVGATHLPPAAHNQHAKLQKHAQQHRACANHTGVTVARSIAINSIYGENSFFSSNPIPAISALQSELIQSELIRGIAIQPAIIVKHALMPIIGIHTIAADLPHGFAQRAAGTHAFHRPA